MDTKFLETFEVDRKPDLVDVEEIMMTDDLGFLVPASADDALQENQKDIIQFNKRIEKWRDMLYGNDSVSASDSLEEKYQRWVIVSKHRKIKARIRKGIPGPFRGEV